MPNKIIENILKERLQSDIDDNESQLHNYFLNDAWKKQSLATFYGAAPASEHLVDIATIRVMEAFCLKYNRRLPKPVTAWLISMVNTKTPIFDGSSQNNALDLLSTAASYTEG